MNYLVKRTKYQLLFITIGIPFIGYILSSLLSISNIEWFSVSYMILPLWWLSAVNHLNSIGKKFNLLFSNIAGIFVFSIFFLDAFFFEMNWKSTNEYLLIVINIATPLLAYYLLYILTRIYGLTINNKEPKGLEIFPTFLWFVIFPIGIWKYQNNIRNILEKIDFEKRA
jgi:hypothetical protein